MTTLMTRAIQQMSTLPEDKQDHLAQLLLDALDDLAWDKQFAESQDVLATLADEGNANFEAGRTRRMGA